MFSKAKQQQIWLNWKQIKSAIYFLGPENLIYNPSNLFTVIKVFNMCDLSKIKKVPKI